MRRATSDTKWLRENEDSDIFGISLGSDFCAEHEQGVPSLRNYLGLPSNTLNGLSLSDYVKLPEDKRKSIVLDVSSITVSKLPKSTYVEYEVKSKDGKVKTPAAYFGVTCSDYDRGITPDAYDAIFYDVPGDKSYVKYPTDVVTSWSEDGFIIHVLGQENIDKLKRLYKAFKTNDIVFGGSISSWNKIGNRGLSFGFLSSLDDDTKAVLYKYNVDLINLYEDIRQTGIIEKLESAKKGFYALSPNRDKDGTIKFYLNPMDQANNNSNWVTVKDLEDWIEGEGIIPKNPKTPLTGMNI